MPMSTDADRPAMAHQRPRILLVRVLAALLLQLIGYAAILVLFPHGDPSSLVEALSGVPPVVLIPLAIPAIPATLLAIAVGVGLAAAGLPPSAMPALLLARGDVLVFASATALAVAAAWLQDRAAQRR